MAGPNKSKLIPRRTVTAGQGDEDIQLTKNEITRLTALTGLMSLFMFGTDANDLFNEEAPNTASIAKSMKSKSGKGLIPTLKDIAESVANIHKEINELANPVHDPMLDTIVDALDIKNEDSIFNKKLDAIILRLDQSVNKQEPNNVSKLLIEINGSTDLSQLIEQLYLLGDKDIVGDAGILSKLDKIISSVKTSVEKSLDIDISKSLSKINDIDKLIAAVQNIIMNIQSIKLSKDIYVKIGELNRFFEDANKNDTIVSLFTNLNNFLNENKAFENDSKASIEKIKSFNEIIEMLINISKVEIPNVKAINTINKLVDEKGQLPQILQDINTNLTQPVSKNAEANLKLVMSLFDTISNVGDIGIIKQIRMKTNIWFIRHFLTKDIISVIASLHKSADKIKKEQDGNQFKIFSSFIGSVIKLGEIDKQSKTKMTKNLWWIKHFIANMTTDIIKQLVESTKDIESKDTKDKVEILTKFVGSLPEIADFGIKKFLKYSLKVEILRSFIRDSIQDLIAEIANLEMTDEAKTSFDNVGEIIKSMNASLDQLESIKKILTYEIKISTINDSIMTQLIRYGAYTITLQRLIENINNDELARLSTIIDIISGSLEGFKNVNYEKVYDNIIAGIDSLDKLNKFTNAIIKVGKNAQEIDTESIENIKSIVNQISEINFGALSDAISKSSDTDKFIKNIEPLIKGANAISKLGIIDSTLEKGAKGINKMIDQLIEGVNKFDNVDQQSIDNATKTIDTFMQLVVKSAAVMLLGALAMTIIDIGNLIAFTVSLTGFIVGVGYALKCASSIVTDSSETIDAFGTLIVKSALVLIIGSLITHFITFEDILTFTGMLLAFIGGTMAVYKWASKNMDKAVEGLRDFSIMIVASGIVLALGSLITKYVKLKDILTFTVMLGLFIWGTMAIYQWASKNMDKAVDGLRDFSIMILASGIVLALGSLITANVSLVDILTFTGMLALFIGSTMLVYIIASNFMGDAVKGLREFGTIIVASGVLLMLGSLLTKAIGIVPVLAFTGMLTLFIVSTVLVYWIASKHMDKALKGAAELGVLVLLSGITLMLGALIVDKIGLEPVAEFAGILALFVGGIMFIYVMASKFMGKAIRGAVELGALVLLSGISLALGALIVDKVGADKVAIFGVMLLAFVGGLTWIYSKFRKKILLSLPAAAGMGVIAILSALALGVGIMFMDKYPDGADKILAFVAADLILVGGFALILKYLGKINKSVAIQGTILLGIIVGLAALSGLTIGMIASIGDKYDLNKTWVVIGQIGTVIGGLTALAIGLGAIAVGGGALLIGAGVAILGTIVGIAILAAEAMKAIAGAMIAMQSVKKFNPKPIIEGIKSFIEITQELKPLAKDSLAIIMASNAIRSLKYVLSDISEAVQEYAELKIPIYEGTKVVGYRQLNKKDFKSAANNVKIIIETLGGAVMDAYDAHPDMFEANLFGNTPFGKVSRALSNLGPMLSRIAKSVKDYASLKVPIYEGTKLTGYESLKPENFKDAANNVKLVIETLGGAVMASYDAHPDMFETNFFGNSPFGKVTRALGNLGPMLSKIAKSVKDYASLLIPDYGNGTKIVKYDKLTNQHFKDAANNVKLIIETLGGAIIQVYEAHPDYYETSGGFLGFGASSPFGKTVDANMKLAKLISKISVSVRDFAASKVPIKWDSKGNATAYESLTQKHFDAANKAIVAVITTLGNAVLESGKKMDEMGGPKHFKKVVNAQAKLGDLISKISKSVLHFAQGKVPTGFDAKSGEPTGYESLGEKHFRAASNSIIAVITTLGSAVMKSGEEMDKTLSPKKFKKVVEAQSKLGNLISTISESVLNFANGKVPIGYNEDGSAKGYEPLGEKHFVKASNSIQQVITTLGQSIIDAYDKHGEWFDDGEDSKFAMACQAIGSMGSMISSIATGMQAYADMKIPIYDANGAVTGYKPIDDKILVGASKTIGKIITNLGQTIMNEYEAHGDWFDDGTESAMGMASAAIGSMGSMLSSVAEGIQSYANLMIPDQWDTKGNPIHFTKMKDQDFTNAGNNIGKIISLLGKTIINLYNGKDFEGKNLPGLENAKEMFQFDPDKQKDSPFNNVLNSCINMGEMITSISEGIQSYALLNMPTGFDATGKPTGFTKMDPGMFGKAAQNIGTVISTIGGAIMTAFGAHKDWFELPPIKTRQKGIAGFFGATEESPQAGDPPFIKVMKGLTLMGGVITSIAAGVQLFASGRVPTYDESGKVVGYDKMDDTVFTAAATAISSVITIMGNTFDTIYTKHPHLFDGDKAKKITDATVKMGSAINGIARAIQTYANLKYATAWNEDGTPKSFEKMTTIDFVNAAITINAIITTIASAISEAADNKVFTDASISVLGLLKVGSGNKVVNMLNALQKTSGVLSSLASTIQQYANLKYAIAWDPKGKPIMWMRMQKTDFENAAKSIYKVITHIAKAITESVDGNEKIFGKNILQSPAYTAAMAVGKMGEALNVIAQSISYYAKSEFPVITWNNGKASTKIYKLNPPDYAAAETVISTVILCVARTIDSIYKAYPELFDIKVGSAIDNIKNGVSVTNTIIQTLSKQISEIAKVDFASFVQSLSGESDSLKSAIDILANMFDAMQYGSRIIIKTENERNVFNPLFALQDDTDIRKVFDKIPGALASMLTVVKSSLDSVSAISNQFTTQKESIELLQIESINNAIDKIIAIFDKINGLKNTLSGDNASIGSFSQNNASLIVDDIVSIKDIVLAVLDTLKLWQDNIDGLADVSLENSIIPLLKGYQEVANLAQSINSSLNSSDEGVGSSLQSWFGGLMGDNDEGSAFENINALNASISDLIAVATVAEQYGTNGYSTIGKGIETIQNAINNIRGIQTFSQHKDILGKYVNTINTLDPKKMNSMTNFVNAMNKLANKMGNLDKLTLAIAENLTSVLEKLTVRMEDAKKTILKSEELQNRRQGRLEKTISSIKEIMSQKLVIEISQVDDTTSDIPSVMGDGGQGNPTVTSTGEPSVGGGGDIISEGGTYIQDKTDSGSQNSGGQSSGSQNQQGGQYREIINKLNAIGNKVGAFGGYVQSTKNTLVTQMKKSGTSRTRT